MTEPNPTIRLSLPSKGRLAEDCLSFLAACGLPVYKPNPRQYEAVLPAVPDLHVLFQRPVDIAVSVRDGSVTFGITGRDVVEEFKGENSDVILLHNALNFGGCTLNLAVPEDWQNVLCVPDLTDRARQLGRPLRVATKYPTLAGRFLAQHNVPYQLVHAEGTLETAPAIGYADLICDIVSSGQTLRDNRLRPLPDGVLLTSQAVLIANRQALRRNPAALPAARQLLEYFEAYLRASDNLAVFVNMRGDSPEAIAERIFQECHIHGLQGPTISRVILPQDSQSWYAVNLIVPRRDLFQTIQDLRRIGGSGVVAVPVTYIFEEEPPRYTAMLAALNDPND